MLHSYFGSSYGRWATMGALKSKMLESCVTPPGTLVSHRAPPPDPFGGDTGWEEMKFIATRTVTLDDEAAVRSESKK